MVESRTLLELPLFIGYIDPGTGFVLVGTVVPYLYAAVAALVAALLWPLRMLWRKFQRWRFNIRARRVIMLGFDGMEPQLAEKWMDEGKLPNLARLRTAGGYQRLPTTTPPESPVAWSSFLTGEMPGAHGVFDFIRPDFQTYLPHLATGEVERTARWFALGKLRFPVRLARVTRRAWRPFYQRLAAQGVPVRLLRQPLDFPVGRGPAQVLAALGVTDLRGRQGDYRLITAGEPPAGVPAEKIIRLGDGDEVVCALPGPRRDDDGLVTIPLRLSRVAGMLALAAGDSSAELRVGQWSPLLEISFQFSRGVRLRGLLNFHLVSIRPLTLYVSPIMPHPDEQPFPFANPPAFGRELWRRHGACHTLGMAEPTEAYKDGAIDDAAFLAATAAIREERERMFLGELDRWRDGLLGMVFDLPDRVQHLFWREMEEHDPLLGRVIERSYQQLDRLVGEVRQRMGGDDCLLVFSDHGFAPFRREFHLNRWLADNGYLAGPPGDRFFRGVNWPRSRAYNLGFCGIYLNRAGREREGVVSAAEAHALAREIRVKLLAFRDPQSGEAPVSAVALADEVYAGADAAPDLVVGCARGWRVASQSALGGISTNVTTVNAERWSGDHCIDPALVPGVLFSAVAQPPLTSIAGFGARLAALFQVGAAVDAAGK